MQIDYKESKKHSNRHYLLMRALSPAHSNPGEGTLKRIEAVHAIKICRSSDRLDGNVNASTDLNVCMHNDSRMR